MDGTLSVLEAGMEVESEGEVVYVSQVWLDSHEGVLWVTDQNWPDNGGGLFRATLDCDSGALVAVEKVFTGKNAYSVRPVNEDWVFLSREIDAQPHQLSIFDDEGAVLAQAQAFDDDEAIFSALASDGQHILVGDNSEFSGLPTRISHLSWDGGTLSRNGIFDFEDPVSIVIKDEWALIASGYGDSIWQYHLPSETFSSVMSLPLPSLVLSQGDFGYAVGNTQVQKLSLSTDGFIPETEIITLSGVGGIIGAVGVFGAY